MNPEKFHAAQQLNQLENSLNIINEQVDQQQAVLDNTRLIQAQTKAIILQLRQAVADMPDDAV